MTPWRWWWLSEGGDNYGDWRGEFANRQLAIANAQRELLPGTRFDVMEARSSDAVKYEGADYVPFLRTRNRQSFVAGPTLALEQPRP